MSSGIMIRMSSLCDCLLRLSLSSSFESPDNFCLFLGGCVSMSSSELEEGGVAE